MRLLYERELGGGDGGDTMETMILDSIKTQPDPEYIIQTTQGVWAHREHLDQIIQQYAIGWKLERLAKVDVSVLRLSLYELIYRQDIPVRVIINESVSLAKKYGGPDSGAFVNGLLASFVKTLPPERLTTG